MKYKVVAYLETYAGVFDSPPNKIRYKLKRKGWFGFWHTVNDSDDEAVLQKQADELNLLKNQ